MLALPVMLTLAWWPTAKSAILIGQIAAIFTLPLMIANCLYSLALAFPYYLGKDGGIGPTVARAMGWRL